jgi:hypothetical protein
MLIRGRCHCGNIAFELTWDPAPSEIPARACGCSFCRKHGGVWTATPHGVLVVGIQRPAQLSRYEFATATAQFQVCTNCGVVPLVTSRIATRLYAVVNVNAFEDIDTCMLRHQPVSFEGEATAARLERRQQGWIGQVTYRAL